MLGFGGIIMSFLGWSFYHIKFHGKGLRNWQWLNVCIASFSFLSAVLTFFFLADSPAKAKWATPEERTKFIERVRPNNQGIRQKVWKKAHALEAFKDPYTYLMFCLALFNTLVVGGLGKFSALLINKAFGFDVLEALLLSMPLSFLLVILYWTAAWLIRKTGQTLLVLVGYCCINIVGTIVLITVAPAPHTKAGLLVTFYLMQSFQACNAAVFLMLSRNVAGQTKKSITYATTYMAWASGNAIAPQVSSYLWTTADGSSSKRAGPLATLPRSRSTSAFMAASLSLLWRCAGCSLAATRRRLRHRRRRVSRSLRMRGHLMT